MQTGGRREKHTGSQTVSAISASPVSSSCVWPQKAQDAQEVGLRFCAFCASCGQSAIAKSFATIRTCTPRARTPHHDLAGTALRPTFPSAIMKPHVPSLPHRLLGWFLAAAVLALTTFVVSPHAHAALHPDAGHSDHACPVTALQQGFSDAPPPAVLIEAPAVSATSAPTEVSLHRWSTPDYWHVPAHAPPQG
jgi:hypothetical protein